MALNANRMAQAIVDGMKAANPDVFGALPDGYSADMEAATLASMVIIATAIVNEIDANAELNSASTGTPGVID